MLHVILCGYKCGDTLHKCLSSIEMQTMKEFKVWMSIDQEPRKYLVKNTYDTVMNCTAGKNDVLVFVDADDFLCDEDAFKIISETYKDDNLLLTYGSYVNLSDSKRGKFSIPYQPGESFACSPWRGSHLKTMRRKLFNSIPENRFKDPGGEWFKCCADRAMMIPAMEIAGYDRIKWIETILYCYNDQTLESCWKTNRELSIKTRNYLCTRQPLEQEDL